MRAEYVAESLIVSSIASAHPTGIETTSLFQEGVGAPKQLGDRSNAVPFEVTSNKKINPQQQQEVRVEILRRGAEAQKRIDALTSAAKTSTNSRSGDLDCTDQKQTLTQSPSALSGYSMEDLPSHSTAATTSNQSDIHANGGLAAAMDDLIRSNHPIAAGRPEHTARPALAAVDTHNDLAAAMDGLIRAIVHR